MRRLICIVVAAGLSGCASLSTLTGRAGDTSQAEALRAIGEHLDGCDRHYQGTLGLAASFTFNIDCRGRAAPQS